MKQSPAKKHLIREWHMLYGSLFTEPIVFTSTLHLAQYNANVHRALNYIKTNQLSSFELAVFSQKPVSLD